MIDLRKTAAVCGAVLAVTLGIAPSALAASPQTQVAATGSSATQSSVSAAKQLSATNDVLTVALSGGAPSGASLSAAASQTSGIVSVTDQCGKPLAQRTGAWACAGTPEQATTGAATANGTPDISASAAQTGGYCLAFSPNCWGVTDDFSAEFDGDNTYGYGKKVLGTYEWGTNWKLTGYVSKSQPFWAKFTDPVRDLTMTSDRLYYDKDHRSGERLNPPKTDPRVIGNKVGFVSTGSTGSVLRDGTKTLGGVMQTMSWHVAGYPGLWVAYVKSPQFIKDGNVYRFIGPQNLPQDAWNVYWNPAG